MSAILQIVVPDLLHELDRALAANSATAAKIADALSRATSRPNEEHGGVKAAMTLCGFAETATGSVPSAAMTARYDLGADASAGLLRADPVFLRADMSRLTLYSARDIGLDEREADAILSLLNATFAPEGLHFLRGRAAARWYVEGAPAPAGPTFSPNDLRGQALEPTLAAMRDMGTLNRIMTEAQMVLHECAVNEARAATGQPPVNSLWLWSGASVPAPGGPTVARIMTNCDEIAACARYAGVPCSADAAQLADLLPGHSGTIAVLMDTGAMDDLALGWLGDIVQAGLSALRARHIAQLVVLTRTRRYQLGRYSAWRVWRNGSRFMTEFRAKASAAGAP